MIEGVTAQVNWEQAGVFAGVLIAGLGGQKGLEALILAWRGRRGPTANEQAAADRAAYPCVLHEQFERHLDERHQAVLTGIHEVKDAITRLHERIDRG